MYEWVSSRSQWEQVGFSILGLYLDANIGDDIGISGDGTVVVVTGRLNDSRTEVRTGVYEREGQRWVLRGSLIDGISRDGSGCGINLSEGGEVLVLGCSGTGVDVSNGGAVRVFVWSGTAVRGARGT